MISRFKQQLSEFLGLSSNETEKCVLGPFAKSKHSVPRTSQQQDNIVISRRPQDFVVTRTPYGIEFNEIVIRSASWILNVEKILHSELGILVFLNKVNTFQSALQIASSASWTCHDTEHNNCYKWLMIKQEEPDATLTSFRINRIATVVNNIVNKFGNSNGNDTLNLYITHKSNTAIPDGFTLLLCSVVLGRNSRKSLCTVDELYEQLRPATGEARNDFTFDKFKDVITFNVLKVKPSNTVTVSCPPSEDFYDVKFILYNYARITAILEEFEGRVTNFGYSQLPPVDKCDFSVLTRQEEWNLLLKYIVPYPDVIIEVVKELSEGKVAIHKLCNFLYSMVCEFSSYYKRERILWENKEFYLSLMHARLHLVISVRQVLHDALTLLDITPLRSM